LRGRCEREPGASSHAPARLVKNRSGGFARFAGARFTLRRSALADSFVHLTNVAVQRRAPGYDKAGGGGKWSLRSLRLYLEGKHGARVCAVYDFP
jgi:tubulin polyglutamylase TTLL9